MTESTNPIFNDEKEFLERQKEEYKNALLYNVEDIKGQSQRIGKKVLIAGGVLAGVVLVSKLFRSKDDKKDNRYYLSDRKARRTTGRYERNTYARKYGYEEDFPGQYDYDEREDYRQREHHANNNTSVAKSFAESDLFKMISHQVSALLLLILTRKIEEYVGTSVLGKDKSKERPVEGEGVVIIEEAVTVDPDTTYTDPDVR